MKRFLVVVGACVVVIAGIVLARGASYRLEQAEVAPAPDVVIPPGAAERLAGSLRIPTISHEDPGAFDARAFEALHAALVRDLKPQGMMPRHLPGVRARMRGWSYIVTGLNGACTPPCGSFGDCARSVKRRSKRKARRDSSWSRAHCQYNLP